MKWMGWGLPRTGLDCIDELLLVPGVLKHKH